MKKILSLTLILSIVLAVALPIQVCAFANGIYTYTVSDGNATITRCANTATGEISIPSTLDGYPVISIGNYAFMNCSLITSISIPNGVTGIEDGAFWFCSSLTSITIPDSVTSIGVDAFYGCSSLIAINVDSNNPNYSSEDGVLFDKNKTVLLIYPKGKSSALYTIPNSVTSIGEWAFAYCSSLTSITIPNSVTSIGDLAFNGSSLTSITIPDSVTSIGGGAFYDCSSLIAIDVDSNNPNYSSEDGVLFDKNKIELFKYPEGKSSALYTIPNSVTSIRDSAFDGCSLLTSITIPNSVTSIGLGAFEYCSSLTSITIPSKVTSIGEWTFIYCSSLTSITIPSSVINISYGAFYGCNSLTIYGTYGSYAQSYANETVINFVATSYIYSQIESYSFTGNTFSGTANVHNYTATDTNSTVLAALYDADSMMIGCKLIDMTLKANADNTVNFSIDVSSVPSSYTVKLFTLNSTANLQPLTDIAISYN